MFMLIYIITFFLSPDINTIVSFNMLVYNIITHDRSLRMGSGGDRRFGGF